MSRSGARDELDALKATNAKLTQTLEDSAAMCSKLKAENERLRKQVGSVKCICYRVTKPCHHCDWCLVHQYDCPEETFDEFVKGLSHFPPEALLRASAVAAGVARVESTELTTREEHKARQALATCWAYIREPSEENREAVDVPPGSGLPEWVWGLSREIVHGAAAGGMHGSYAPDAIQSAANVAGEDAVKEAIQEHLKRWALGEAEPNG